MNAAPIVLFCYNRPRHLKQTLEALQKNPLASESDLIVFSDGAKGENELDLVLEVRQILQNITGFKSVTINTRQENMGLARSIITGLTRVFKNHDRAIVMEDDLVCTPDYLKFMNEALEVYEKNGSVFSISGYSFGVEVPKNYQEDAVLVLRASSWGWATWADRWEKVDWGVSDFKEFLKDKARIDKLKDAGEDIYPMIVKQQRGVIQSWAVRWTYFHVKHGGYCLIPIQSKIKNIGTDGSGTNFTSKTRRYDLEIHSGDVKLNPDLKPNDEITRFIRKKHSPGLIRKTINLIKFGIW